MRPSVTPIERAPTEDPSGDLLLSALIAVGLFCFYLAIQRVQVASYDGKIMLSVAQNLVSKGALTTDPAIDVYGTNTPYSTYGIGMSLLLVPFAAFQGPQEFDGGLLVTLVNPLILAVSGVVLFQLGRSIGWARRWALAAALAFGLLTLAPSQSTELFSEPMVALCTLVALWGCIRWQGGDASIAPWLIGSAISVALLFRPDCLVLVGSVLLFLPLFISVNDVRRNPRTLTGLVLPIVGAAALQGWYNAERFGGILRFGYPGGAYGEGLSSFSTPLWEGLDVLLHLPEKGFFWFNPLLITGLAGFVWLTRRSRALSITILGLTLLRLIVYAMWFTPGGGVGWGPRLLFPLCALLMVPACETWQRVARLSGWARGVIGSAVVALALAAASLTLLSVWVPYEQSWNAVETLQIGEAREEWAKDIHDYQHSILDGPIPANIHLLTRSSRFPLWHFEGGPHATGVLAVAVGIACCAAAGVVAFNADRRARLRSVDSGELADEEQRLAEAR